MSVREFYLRKKYWCNDFLHGAKMWRSYSDILSILKNPESSLMRRRQRMERILSYAKKNSNFYSRLSNVPFSELPVVDKRIILENRDEFLVPERLIPNQIGPVHVQKTSGSTGTPFEIPQDTWCRIRRIAAIKAANELIGFHAFMPLMHLRSVKHYWGFPDDLTFKRDLNILYADNANLTEEKVLAIIGAINDYGIRYVRGYMTTLNTITEYAATNKIELYTHPTFISGGELLAESLRRRIVDDLHCNVISQYANEENGVIGQSKINGRGSDIRLYLANCYCEVLKLDSDEPVGDDELGRVVVTDYTNRAMPMIRYEIGDLAKVGSRTADGEVTSLIDLAGRKTDMIFRTNGQPVDMFNSISPEIYNNPSVRQWQFVQNGRCTYELRICTSDIKIRELEERFQLMVRQILGQDAVVNVVFVEEIPVLNSGKRKVVIQEWKK